MDRYPWLSDAHEVKLDMFFTDKARYDLLTGWMYDVLEGRKKSHVQGKGRPRSGDLLAIPEYVLTELTRLSWVLSQAATELGLDATGFAKFAKDSSVAQVWARERVSELAATGRALRRSGGGDGGV